MNYLTLSQALLIGAAVTGIDPETLASVSRLELLDSALHAPQVGFDNEDFYSDFFMKAAVLCSRLALNHPFPDGNKRLAWVCLVVFCEINGYTLNPAIDDVVHTMTEVASGRMSIGSLAQWISSRVD